MRRYLLALAAAGSLALLSACASNSQRPGTPPQPTRMEQTLARYTAYAGPPVRSFTWLGRFDSWEALGKDQLVVFTTPSNAYLLKVWPPCDLRFVLYRIGLTSTTGTVYSGLDAVTYRSQATGYMRCPIEEIRPVDYKRMRADLRAQRQAAQAQPAPPAQAAPSAQPPAAPAAATQQL